MNWLKLVFERIIQVLSLTNKLTKLKLIIYCSEIIIRYKNSHFCGELIIYNCKLIINKIINKWGLIINKITNI